MVLGGLGRLGGLWKELEGDHMNNMPSISGSGSKDVRLEIIKVGALNAGPSNFRLTFDRSISPRGLAIRKDVAAIRCS